MRKHWGNWEKIIGERGKIWKHSSLAHPTRRDPRLRVWLRPWKRVRGISGHILKCDPHIYNFIFDLLCLLPCPVCVKISCESIKWFWRCGFERGHKENSDFIICAGWQSKLFRGNWARSEHKKVGFKSLTLRTFEYGSAPLSSYQITIWILLNIYYINHIKLYFNIIHQNKQA